MSVFGYCLGPDGAKADQYHQMCPREFTDSNGLVHVCGCPAHETED